MCVYCVFIVFIVLFWVHCEWFSNSKTLRWPGRQDGNIVIIMTFQTNSAAISPSPSMRCWRRKWEKIQFFLEREMSGRRKEGRWSGVHMIARIIAPVFGYEECLLFDLRHLSIFAFSWLFIIKKNYLWFYLVTPRLIAKYANIFLNISSFFLQHPRLGLLLVPLENVMKMRKRHLDIKQCNTN